MNDDLYQTPNAEIESKVEQQGSILKGALFGSLTDIVASSVLGFVFGIVFVAFLMSQGLSEEELLDQLSQFGLTSPIGIFATVLGLLVSFYAGYIGAKKSGGHILIVSGIICLSSNLFAFVMSDGQYTFTENVILTLLTVAAILGGARLWSSKVFSEEAVTNQKVE